MLTRSLGLRLDHPYTECEVHLGKQQRIPSQVQHDRTDNDIPEVICWVWLKYLLPVTIWGVRPKSPNNPWLRVWRQLNTKRCTMKLAVDH